MTHSDSPQRQSRQTISTDQLPPAGEPIPAGGPADTAPLPIGLVLHGVEGDSAEQVLGRISARLLEEGLVGEEFPAALWAREQQYPTGLPTRIATAIPHTDAEHVLTACLAVATLAQPVAFGEMGGPDGDTVDAQLVVMPLVTEPSAVLPALQQMIAVLTDESVVTELLAAQDEDALRSLAERHLRGPSPA